MMNEEARYATKVAAVRIEECNRDPKKTTKIAYKLYCKQGQDAVMELGERLGLRYARCKPCETSTPMFDNACLVCGSPK